MRTIIAPASVAALTLIIASATFGGGSQDVGAHWFEPAPVCAFRCSRFRLSR